MHADRLLRADLPAPPSLPALRALLASAPSLAFFLLPRGPSLLLCSPTAISPLAVSSHRLPHSQSSAEIPSAPASTPTSTPAARPFANNQYVIPAVPRFPPPAQPIEQCASAAQLEHFLQTADFSELAQGTYRHELPAPLREEWTRLFDARAEQVKESMRHFWRAYRQYAFGHDELRPLSKSHRDNWGHIGLTLVDSLDTLWLMGLRKEFDEAVAWVHAHLAFAGDATVSFFEFTIRVVGGLLSAFHLSGDARLLPAIREAGRVVLCAFDDQHVLPHVTAAAPLDPRARSTSRRAARARRRTASPSRSSAPSRWSCGLPRGRD